MSNLQEIIDTEKGPNDNDSGITISIWDEFGKYLLHTDMEDISRDTILTATSDLGTDKKFC